MLTYGDIYVLFKLYIIWDVIINTQLYTLYSIYISYVCAFISFVNLSRSFATTLFNASVLPDKT